MSARMRLTKIMAKLGPRKPKPVLEQAKEKSRWNILRGDKVEVIGRHAEKGKQGVVLQVLRDRDRVIVEGVNMAPKHIKGDPDRGIKGRTVQRERTLPYYTVNLIDPVTGKPTRVTRKYLDDGTKVRVAKKSGAVIPRPDMLTFRKRPVSSIVTESDTLEENVWELSYEPLKSTI
jgi:large subunit ribosomal protein L24